MYIVTFIKHRNKDNAKANKASCKFISVHLGYVHTAGLNAQFRFFLQGSAFLHSCSHVITIRLQCEHLWR